jgi:hypothetical protein
MRLNGQTRLNVQKKSASPTRRKESLPEHEIFEIFMGLHIYLYLHAQSVADVMADVTRMARDVGHRAEVERAIERLTGLAVSFSDIADVKSPNEAPPQTDEAWERADRLAYSSSA